MAKRSSDQDTIVAVATGPGRGAIGIVRISGPEAIPIASGLFHGKKELAKMAGFTAAHGWVFEDGQRLDEVLSLVLRAPNSYTREDTVEFHCHGGPLPLRRVLAAAVRAGARPAEPGEFTKRAFLAGRLDLAQAEAVADLIASETEAAAKSAAAQLAGELSRRLGQRGEEVAELLARLEAGIDFGEEEEVPAVAREDLVAGLAEADKDFSALLQSAATGRRYREGARVVIAGRPNVGKSTLMNALLQTERVIVTPSPGTTRDVVEDLIELSGIPVRLADTAGLREVGDPVERMGVAKARAALAEADLALVLVDGSETLSSADRQIVIQVSCPLILAVNKSDLPPAASEEDLRTLAGPARTARISALTGQGLEELKKDIVAELTGTTSTETPLLANLRHVSALAAAQAALREAMVAAQQGLSDEFTASDLRRALDHLGQITGEAADDELLDLIFSRFCIGK